MSSTPRAIVVDHHAERATNLQQLLEAAGYETATASCVTDAELELERRGADVLVITTSVTSEVGALIGVADDAAVVARMDGPADRVPETLWSAHAVLPLAGDPEPLLHAVERATRESGMRRDLAQLRARSAAVAEERLIGRSSSMAQLRELLGRAASSQRTVLVTGEAGTGKDVVARLVHDLSARASRPYLRVSCSDADVDQLTRELFGTVANGQQPARAGVLELSRGGTVVLDEHRALPTALRARVARAVIERVAVRVGDEQPIALDVRFVLTAREAPANAPRQPVLASPLDGITVLPINVPPLRERRSDIPLLAQHFRARVARDHGVTLRSLHPDAMLSLLAREWMGNVRELEHWAERDVLGMSDAPASSGTTRAAAEGDVLVGVGEACTLEQLEQRYIMHVLQQERGNQSRAAERLGIDRRTLYRKLKEYRAERIDELQEAV